MLDLSNIKESSFDVLPPGNYPVVVEEAAIKTTKSGTGEYINVKLRVFEGSAEGRFLFTMFNIRNANPKATEIGLSNLKTLLKVSGAKDPNQLKDVLDLVGLKATAVVKIKDDEYGTGNVVSYFKPWNVTLENGKKRSDDLPF